MNQGSFELQTGYDQVAEEYTARIFDELQHKLLDRELLDRFAGMVQGLGPVCDLGCGPGHVARYLHGRGVNVFGLDLSPGMVEQARKMNSGIEFQVGDMRALDAADDTWGGIVAFYSLIHIPREEMVAVLQELKRVLRPGGFLFLAFHMGEETIHADEWWGQPVSINFHFFGRAEMEGYLQAAGLEVVESVERRPYPDVEYQSHRAYIFAKKPAESD